MPTTMEVSTATSSAFSVKSLIVRELQPTSVPALWYFWGSIQYNIQKNPFSIENGCSGCYTGNYGCYTRTLHIAGTLINRTCVTSSSFPRNDELVAVEDFIVVGNILYT